MIDRTLKSALTVSFAIFAVVGVEKKALQVMEMFFFEISLRTVLLIVRTKIAESKKIAFF